MTRVARGRPVRVPANVRVFRTGVGLRVRVAGDTREGRVICRIGVAVATTRPSAGVRTRVNREPRVVEHRAQPGHRGMAGVAGCREHCCGVVRVGCSGVVGLVTAVAIGGKVAGVAPFVAGVASQVYVSASQREARFTVIERCGGPRRRRMTHVARGREAARLVIRASRPVVITQVARDASRR